MARGKKKESALTPEEKLAQALVPDWEWPYRIPKNWQWVVLKSCCMDFFSGKSPKYSKEPTDIKIIGQQANRREGIDLSYVKFGTVDFAETQEERMWLQKNDVLLNTLGSGTIGRSGIYKGNERLLTDGHLFVFRSNECYLPDLMYYYLCANEEKIINSANGSTNQKFLSLSAFSTFPLPVPPIAEQQRIVDRIEYLFARLDEAKEKAQSVLDSFETRKAAILHKAFNGELTAKWRAEHSVELESWEHLAYSDIGSSKLGKMLDKAKNEGLPTPYLRNINVRWFAFDLNDVSTMLASEAEIEALSVKKGDLFICEGGEPGRCAIWKESDSNLIFQKALHRFRPNKKVISEFLCYNLYFMSLSGTLEEYFTGTTIKHLTGQSLSKLPIHLPHVPEQTEIVRILDSLFAKEQQAKEAAEAVLEKIDLLKKSILARAFRGELGTNDPTEESATELLKMILNTEKEVSQKKKAKSLPKELKRELRSNLEEKIIKLFFQKDTVDISMEEIMLVSSQTFEVIESLRELERRNILKKQNSGHYKLMR